MTLPATFDRAALHAAYAAGVRPADVAKAALGRLAAANDPALFLHVRTEGAIMADAAALGPFDPAAKPLYGLPFAIKDNIDHAGAPTTAACPAYAYVPEADAPVVAALRSAGAILIGKTNLDQFATGLVGTRSPYGVPRNAIDPTLVPGGSSSGSAVAVASGIVTFALGTDTAGSGRVPAALNGIVGLKPSLGALSTAGVVPACRSLDCVSVFALTVADAFAVFTVAADGAPGDAPARTAPLGAAPPALTLGVPTAETLKIDNKNQAASHEQALQTLERQGATLVPIDFSLFYETAALLYEGAWVAERLNVIEALLARDPPAVHPVTRTIVEPAKTLSAVDAFRGLDRLAELTRALAPILAKVDALAVPTIPGPVTLEADRADPLTHNARLGTYTNFVNLLNLCALAVPTTRQGEGPAGSLTLIARAGRDGAIAAIGASLHHACGSPIGATGLGPPAPITPEAPADGEMVIAAVGAHMSGLPLNHELTSRGGRFLRTAQTAPQYRLYALAGGPPIRPGLVRCGPGESGGAIALELWALPHEEVGGFLAGIPAPLGIGTLTLSDGSTQQGFICEAAGLQGARDITSFGGFRAFLSSA